jgi:hypothetical protein
MTRAPGAGGGGRMVWAAGLLVAAAAGVATAHGLYGVAVAARVPVVIGWLYPVITDGLALLAYAATTRLSHPASRRYAAGIVLLAAGLSGLAQAVNLTGGISHTRPAPAGLRFGVGAWPAIAAALTAHLLHLIHSDIHRPGETHRGDRTAALDPALGDSGRASSAPVVAASTVSVQPYIRSDAVEREPVDRTAAEPYGSPVQPRRTTQPELAEAAATDHDQPEPPAIGGSARDRARQAAHAHHERHGALPTVTQLMHAARVARGTAGPVLKELREAPPGIHVIAPDTTRTNA